MDKIEIRRSARGQLNSELAKVFVYIHLASLLGSDLGFEGEDTAHD
jgi:hypothetical protein